jgi:hypothetical protein
MVEKFYIPHRFHSRGAGVLIDAKAPNVAEVYFDVDGSARYLFVVPRRDLRRLARAIERQLNEVPSRTRMPRR